ncbi:MAG TPA: ATP synthase subunit I [Rickettsiales bacterium]|nr:ATP synthase subunit I [Rickettsiales bacterium]
MLNNMIFHFFIGFITGVLNFFSLKWTINKMLQTKDISIVIKSFILRMTVVCAVFFIFLNKDWKNAVLMVIGFLSIKYLIILSDKIRGMKK